MSGVTSPSQLPARPVSTGVIKRGASSSPLSVRWILYPIQKARGFSSIGSINVGPGEQIILADGGILSSERKCGWTRNDFKLLHPDASQDFYCGKGAKPLQLWGRVDGVEEAIAVCTNQFDQSHSLGLIFGEARLFNTTAIELVPFIRSERAQPVGDKFRQGVQGRRASVSATQTTRFIARIAANTWVASVLCRDCRLYQSSFAELG